MLLNDFIVRVYMFFAVRAKSLFIKRAEPAKEA